jgi:hypothetical protein
MADRYWVGGSANWDSTAGTKWSATSGGAGGASVPTSADAVFFNAASGTVTVTVATGGGTALSINCTGFTGTIAGTAALNISGSVTLVSGMTFSHTGTMNLLATGTLTTAGKTIGPLTINASAGTVTLGGALTLTASGDITLTAGTFTTSASNFAVTARSLIISGTGAKTLTLNGSTVTLSREGPSAFDYSGSNLTFNAGTSTINISAGAGGGNVAFNAGAGLTFNNVNFSSATALSRSTNGANTFNTLTLAAPASAGNIPTYFSGNQTITTLVANGASAVRRLTLASSATGPISLTVGTYTTKTDVDFRDITAAGASSPWSGTRLGNCGGNSNITFTAAKTVYWNLTGTQNWSSTGWATASGGTPALANFPLAQDTAIFDNAGAATTVSIDAPWNIGTVNMSARTSAMTISGANVPTVYGNWTAGSGVTQSFTNSTLFGAAGTQTITSAGKSFFAVRNVNPSGTISLGDALTTTTTTANTGVSLTSGAAFVANNYNVTTNAFVGSTASINLGTGTFTITGTGNCWNCSGTISGSGEIILSNNTTTARAFLGTTSQVYGKLTIGGNTSTSTTTITGPTMTFSEIASTKTVAHTIVFPNTTTTVTNFTVRGTPGNVVTLSRTGASGTFTLTKSGAGIIESDYLSISNSAVSPINTWYAGANSTNGGGNTNWIFTAVPVAGASKFLAFFI